MNEKELKQLRSLQAKWKQEQRFKKTLREQTDVIAELMAENDVFKKRVETKYNQIKGGVKASVVPAQPQTEEMVETLKKCQQTGKA